MSDRELEYVYHRDLRSIDIAKRVLSDLLPEMNPAVLPEEHRQVMRLIERWKDRMQTEDGNRRRSWIAAYRKANPED